MKLENIKKDLVICPNDSEDLTKGKEYLILKVFSDKSFVVNNDKNKKLFCSNDGCGHLEGDNWILK
jgi:hypothetical protein